MAGRIFLSYRRNDDPGFTHALYQRLVQEFPADHLHMDVEGSIAPGDDFVEVISNLVGGSDIVLAVIGPRWLELLKARAGRGVDLVEEEIRAALEQRKRLIPVLVGGAVMPDASELPASIANLTRRNAVDIRAERFGADSRALCDSLKSLLSSAAPEQRTPADPIIRRPTTSGPPDSYQFVVSSSLLRTVLAKTLFASSAAPSVPWLDGIYLHPTASKDGQRLRIVATDGNRLAIVELIDQAGLGAMTPVRLKRDAAFELHALLEGVGGDATVTVSRGEIRFDLQGRSQAFTALPGIFPDYAKVLPNGRLAIARLDRRELLTALETVVRSAQDGPRIRLHFTAQALDIMAEAMPPVRISVNAFGPAAAFSIGFNRTFLQDVVSRLDTKLIEIKFDGPDAAASFHGQNSTFCTYVLMPIKG